MTNVLLSAKVKKLKYNLMWKTHNECTVGKKKEKKSAINSNTNFRREMKFMPIDMDYGLL